MDGFCLEHVAKLELPDTPAVHVTNKQVSRVETEIVESGVRHITCAGAELRCVQGIEVIKSNLEARWLAVRELKTLLFITS